MDEIPNEFRTSAVGMLDWSTRIGRENKAFAFGRRIGVQRPEREVVLAMNDVDQSCWIEEQRKP